MNKKRTSNPTLKSKTSADVPYGVRDKAAVQAFWGGAIAHTGIAELRAKRG
jgi:hypothetical protein